MIKKWCFILGRYIKYVENLFCYILKAVDILHTLYKGKMHNCARFYYVFLLDSIRNESLWSSLM